MTRRATPARVGYSAYRAAIAAGKPEDEARVLQRAAYAKAKEDAAAKVAAEKARKARLSKTCQVCERRIFAELGVIAHHGYERPGGGMQTPSCYGARELPYEAGRDALGRFLEALHRRATAAREWRDAVEAETRPLTVEWQVLAEGEQPRHKRNWVEHSAPVTRETFDSVAASDPAILEQNRGPYDAEADRYAPFTFDLLKASTLAAAERDLAGWLWDHRHHAQRWWDWRKTHDFDDTGWRKI